jgi:hypothetical protein
VKVYKDEEGVESFSEGSDEHVAKTDVLDDGAMILDEHQLEDAYTNAAKMSLIFSEQPALTMADLGIASSSSAPPPPKKATPTPAKETAEKKKAKGSDTETSSSDDDTAPMMKSIGGRREKPKKTLEKNEALGSKAKNLQQIETAANKVLENCKVSLNNFVASTDYSTDLQAELLKRSSEAKAIDTKILIKGGKLDLAQTLNEMAAKVKGVGTYLKNYGQWTKARIEDRGSQRQEAEGRLEGT